MAEPDVELIGPEADLPAPDPFWVISPAAEFDLRCWDGESVAFVCGTADTHLLSPQATLLLQRMRSEPDDVRSASSWSSCLDTPFVSADCPGGLQDNFGLDGSASESEESAAGMADIHDLLEELHRIGLVRRLAP